MLGLLFIYLIGKQFYDLAQKHDRSEWGYGFLGVVMYYVGTFIGGIVIGLFCYFTDIDFDGLNDLVLSLIGMPFGLLVSWLTHVYLNEKFTNNTSGVNTLDDTILDEGL